MKLKVISPFGEYQVGDEIVDQDKIKAVLESEQQVYVIRVADAPVETPKSKK